MPGVILTRISGVYGENRGNRFDDLQAILLAFKDNATIKKISIKKIEIRYGGAIDSLKFTYNVETEKGSNEFPGGLNGGYGGTLGTIALDHTKDERILGIFGRIGVRDNLEVIKYLQFKISKRHSANAFEAGLWTFGTNNINDKSFILPEGVIFGSSDTLLRSLGTYEIAEMKS